MTSKIAKTDCNYFIVSFLKLLNIVTAANDDDDVDVDFDDEVDAEPDVIC